MYDNHSLTYNSLNIVICVSDVTLRKSHAHADDHLDGCLITKYPAELKQIHPHTK